MNTKEEHDKEIGFWLGKVCRLHHVCIQNTLEGMGVYRGQPPLLFSLMEKDGSTHKELAETMHVTPATVSNMVKRMEKNGLLVRRSDSHDERISRVFLTDKGRQMTKEIGQVFKNINDELVKGFSAEEIELSLALIKRIYRNLLPKNELE